LTAWDEAEGSNKDPTRIQPFPPNEYGMRTDELSNCGDSLGQYVLGSAELEPIQLVESVCNAYNKKLEKRV
jgi:hypothetical protein